ncbi:MAG: methyltransferase domain-containing protein [Chloroflexi bacterium]|nr:methyltransferase domain-containing protein [Chloroflexota bacterium]
MYDKIAHYYDLTHDQLTEDVAFILALAQEGGGPVLELGCGSGRLLRPLARAGFRVTGVDNSAAMLDRARVRFAGEDTAVQQRLSLIPGDMTALSLPHQTRFALVIIPYNTLLHLDSDQAAAALRGIRPVLGANGRLFIDLINPLAVANTPNDATLSLEAVFTDPANGYTVLQLAANRLDDGAQTLHITWIYDASPPDGGPVHRTIAQATYHYLYPHQLELLLREAGFRLRSLTGGYNGEPFNEESERLLIVAEQA